MKRVFLAGLALASSCAFAGTLSTERSLTLEDQLTVSTTPPPTADYFGEVHIPEPLAYVVLTGGGKRFSFSLIQHYASTQELMNAKIYRTGAIDRLAPVKEKKASVATVYPGYCAILSDARFFAGRWFVLGPGTHRLANYTYKARNADGSIKTVSASFDNAAMSVATYKMIGSGCLPEQDIPTLKDASGHLFPLIATNGHHEQAEAGVFGEGNFEAITGRSFVASRYPIEIEGDGKTLTSWLGGGFSDKAVTLNVPKCYSVQLTYTKPTDDAVLTARFDAGTYNLPAHGISKDLLAADVTRTAGCAQAPRPSPIVLSWFPNKCLHPNGGSPNPVNNTWGIVYTGCTPEPRLNYSLTAGGSLKQESSGKCLHPQGGSPTPAEDTPLVLFSLCDESRLQFKWDGTTLRHVTSGMCVMPRGYPGSGTPPPDTTLFVLKKCVAYPIVSRINGTLPFDLGEQGTTSF